MTTPAPAAAPTPTPAASPAPAAASPAPADPNPNPTPASPPASDSTASPAEPSGTPLGQETPPNEPAQDLTAAGGTDLGAEATPPEDAPPAWAEFHGAPEGEADYEEFVAPDGLAVDPELRAEFSPLAKELNLSQKGAQRLVDLKAKDIQLQLRRWGEHLVTLKTQAQADPEIGGAKYEPALTASRAAMSKFGTPALRKVMNDYGVGAHPEMIRFMSKVGLAMGETPALEPGGGSGAIAEKPLHEILYKDSK